MITKIEALNYKCLRYVSQTLGPFQLLVGPNGSGKSTFLDILAFLKDLLEDGLDKAILKRATHCKDLIWHGSENCFELAVELKIPVKLEDKLKRKSNEQAYTHCRYEIRIGVNEKGELSILAENLWLTKGDRAYAQKSQLLLPFPSVPKAPSSIITGRTRPGCRTVIKKTEGRDYFQSETTKWNNMFPVGPHNPSLASLPDDRERFPVSLWVLDILSESIQELVLNSTKMREPCRPDAPRSFLPDGSNLPIVIEELKTKWPKKFEAWQEHLKTVFSNLGTVNVVERDMDRFKYLTVSFDSFNVPSWCLSDGTLRFLALTLLAYLPTDSYSGIYLIEEPENGIHPTALDAIYQSLSSAYAFEGQVVVATHSPLLLELAKLEELLCFASTHEGATAIVRGDEHPRLKDWKGEVNLETLFASGVLG